MARHLHEAPGSLINHQVRKGFQNRWWVNLSEQNEGGRLARGIVTEQLPSAAESARDPLLRTLRLGEPASKKWNAQSGEDRNELCGQD